MERESIKYINNLIELINLGDKINVNMRLHHLKNIIKDENVVLPQADVSGRSELLFAFIAEIKKEFADQNWDYLAFIAERVLKANNSH